MTDRKNALDAHLAHGDVLGSCDDLCTDSGACDDGDACTRDSCEGSSCVNEPLAADACDDGRAGHSTGSTLDAKLKGKSMKGKKFSMFMVVAVAAMAVCVASPATAQVTFDWVMVGNPGNATDPLNEGNIPGIGSVSYRYRIAKHEVTNDQYAVFLNAVAADDANNLYNANMGSDPRGGITQSGSSPNFTYAVKANMGNKPVNYVSILDQMRFVNWLDNGQPIGAQDSGTTEDGVYTISDGVSETRAGDAQFFIPTENEWYKAAYHDPRTATDGGPPGNDFYWLYPTASNSDPTVATADATGNISNPSTNVVNYASGADWNGQDGNVTTVGSAGALSESYYGTSDQGGNVFERLETVIEFPVLGKYLVVRGGSYDSPKTWMWSSFDEGASLPTGEAARVGFRVASPSLLLLMNQEVQALFDEGVINRGQANSLTKQLGKIEWAIDEGKLNVACNELDDFIGHVLGLFDDGVLTSEEADSLIANAELMSDLLECP